MDTRHSKRLSLRFRPHELEAVAAAAAAAKWSRSELIRHGAVELAARVLSASEGRQQSYESLLLVKVPSPVRTVPQNVGIDEDRGRRLRPTGA